MALNRLNEARRTRRGINREDRDVVLPAVEDFSAFERDLALVAVGEIDETAARMHVDRSRALTRFDGGRVGQRVLDEHRIVLQRAVRSKVEDIELVLPLDRDKDPRLRGMEIEVPRSEAAPGSRRDRGEVGQSAAVDRKDLERARIFRLAAG